jgi:hypothetical protein
MAALPSIFDQFKGRALDPAELEEAMDADNARRALEVAERASLARVSLFPSGGHMPGAGMPAARRDGPPDADFSWEDAPDA